MREKLTSLGRVHIYGDPGSAKEELKTGGRTKKLTLLDLSEHVNELREDLSQRETVCQDDTKFFR
jgi:hypothetical protein